MKLQISEIRLIKFFNKNDSFNKKNEYSNSIEGK